MFEEITSNAINEDAVWENGLNLLNKISLGVDYHIAEKFAVFASASYNVHVSNTRDLVLSNEFVTDIAFHPFYDRSGSNVKTQMWVGAKVGVRLILNQ